MFADLTDSMKSLNKSFGENIEEGIALASNLSKYGSDITMDAELGMVFSHNSPTLAIWCHLMNEFIWEMVHLVQDRHLKSWGRCIISLKERRIR